MFNVSNLPEIFYYHAKQSAVSYTNTPTDNLDINRMIALKPCFLKTQVNPEKKPKTLIFSDWSLYRWSRKKKCRVSYIFELLINQGFKIYFAKLDQLLPMSTQTVWSFIDESNLNGFTKLILPEKIYQMAAQYQLSKDQIHILDDHGIDCLCSGQYNRPRALSLMDYIEVQSKLDDGECLWHLLEHLTPKISVLEKGFVLNETSNSSYHELTNRLNKIFGPLVEICYSVKLCNESILKKFIHEMDKNPDSFKDVAVIDLSSEFILSADCLIKFLQIDTQLQSFNFSVKPYLECFKTLLPNSLPQLTEVNVQEANLGLENLVSLMMMYEVAPNIESLRFINLSLIDSDIKSLGLHQLSSLKNLSLNFRFNQPNGSEILVQIMRESSNLISLQYSGLVFLDPLPLGSQFQVKQMLIHNSDFKQVAWESLWSAVVDNLCSLELINTTIQSEQLMLKPALKLHCLKLDDVSCELMGYLLFATPYLRVLKFDNVRRDLGVNRDLFLNLLPGSLAYLEEISFERATLDIRSLVALLNAAPNIKKISLIDMTYEGEEDYSLLSSLLQLESLTIENDEDEVEAEDDEDEDKEEAKDLDEQAVEEDSEDESDYFIDPIICQLLKILLCSSPNLKELRLIEQPGLLPEGLPLMFQLRSIHFQKKGITLGDLQNFFIKTPALEKITIIGDRIPISLNDTDSLVLENLRDVSIYGTITSLTLNVFLKHMPNIERLNLCDTNFDQLDQMECAFLGALSTLNVNQSNISVDVLFTILLVTPHLNSLDLANCINLLDDDEDSARPNEFKLPPGSLPLLKKIHYDSSIHPKVLECLETAAPHIEERKINTVSPLTKINNLIHSDSNHSLTRPVIIQDRPHDFKRMANFEPTSQHKFHFKYQGKYHDASQAMIIEKISQYLTLIKENLDYIPYIQDGICEVLVNILKDQGREKFEQATHQLLEWRGTPATLTEPLIEIFEDILFAIEHSYQSEPSRSEQFIAPNLEVVIGLQAINVKSVLYTPWHAVLVHKKNELEYDYYNPNASSIVTLTMADLMTKLKLDIGEIISIKEYPILIIPSLGNWDVYIEQGGLIKLGHYCNRPSMIAQFPMNHQFSAQVLEGLFLKTLQGIPIWWIGCQSQQPAIKSIFCHLQAQYKQLHANRADIDNVFALNQYTLSIKDNPFVNKDLSMNHVKRKLRRQVVDHWLQENIVEDSYLKDQQAEALAKINEFKVALIHQQHDDLAQSQTPVEFCRHILQLFIRHPVKNDSCLLQFDSDPALDGMCSILIDEMTCRDIPVFYIDTPNDLICSAAFVQCDGNQGKIVHGPGGALYDFITRHHDFILLIDYREFDADDIVQFNSILDKKPSVDGIALPQHTLVIGLVNQNHPKHYHGADFYSRFSHQPACPFSIEEIQAHLKLASIQSMGELSNVSFTQQPSQTIQLFHSSDWESELLGRWLVKGPERLTFQEGVIKTIDYSKALIIQNGCWADHRFRHFWNKIRQIGSWHAGKLVRIAPEMPIYRSDSYDWESLKSAFVQREYFDKNAFVLNAHTLSCCYDRQQYDETNKSLKYVRSMLHEVGSEFYVNLTSSLSDDAWARLLTICSHLGITLNVYCAPHVVLPIVLGLNRTSCPDIKSWDERKFTSFQIIVSTDQDTSLAKLEKQQHDWLVIDVSNCEAHDLLIRLDRSLDQKASLSIAFEQSNGALLTALELQRNVILKGALSVALIDALMPLLVAIEQGDYQLDGRLIILTDHGELFSVLRNRVEHQVTVQEKLSLLPLKHRQLLLKHAKTESLSQLRARSFYLKMNPNGQSDDAWLGIYQLPGGIVLSEDSLNVVTSKQQAHQFMQDRLTQVSNVLVNGPYVFLTGLSGVGKSTFVQSILCGQNSPYQLFQGQEKMKDWASSRSEQWMILFLDEVNISSEERHEFEGLFQSNPGILIEGTYYPLTRNHKLVCAGNPLSYGDERRIPAMIKRHGRSILFQPISQAVIYQNILLPIFKGQFLSRDLIQQASQHILDAYVFICHCSQTEVLISPRDLEMMALTALVHYKKQGGDFINCIKNTVYELGKLLIPVQLTGQQFFFDQRFIPEQCFEQPFHMPQNQFYIAPSRKTAVLHLHERLQLRQWRLDNRSHLNERQLYGGLGGLVFEGAPGIGKSEILTQVMSFFGYHEVAFRNGANERGKAFYRMPVSMGLSEKKALLNRAFDEGAIVIIDEINSSPMMEAFLNALLMGRHPETGARPEYPGFMVLGTQNPISMAGRRAASTALLRRLTTLILPEYTAEEMQDILTRYSISSIDAKLLIQAYQAQRLDAKANRLHTVPCFRDLLRVAESIKAEILAHIAEMKKKLPPLLESPNSPSKWECLNDSFWTDSMGEHGFFSKEPVESEKMNEEKVAQEDGTSFKHKRSRLD